MSQQFKKAKTKFSKKEENKTVPDSKIKKNFEEIGLMHEIKHQTTIRKRDLLPSLVKCKIDLKKFKQ